MEMLPEDLTKAPFEIQYQQFKLKAKSYGKSGKEALTEFWKLFDATAENFRQMALRLRYAEEEGEDLSDAAMKMNGLFVALRRIAYGQMLPEVIVRYPGRLTLVNRLGTLPITDQEEIVNGGGVKLLVYAPDGSRSHLVVDPCEMSADQIKQAFASDHVRTESEQAVYLAAWREKQRKPLPQELHGWKLDPDLGIAKKGQNVLRLEELEEIVRILRKGRDKTA